MSTRAWRPRCRPTIPTCKLRRDWPLLTKMIADGYTGRKGKGGFYRLNNEGGKRVKESIDLKTGDYAPSTTARLESRRCGQGRAASVLVSHTDKGGQYAWRVLSEPAGLRRVAGARDRRRHGRSRSGDEDRLQLEVRPVRDDRPDRRRLVRASACAPRSMRVPTLLESAAKAGGFYRVDGRQAATISAPTAPTCRSSAPTACCCSPTSSGRPSRS